MSNIYHQLNDIINKIPLDILVKLYNISDVNTYNSICEKFQLNTNHIDNIICIYQRLTFEEFDNYILFNTNINNLSDILTHKLQEETIHAMNLSRAIYKIKNNLDDEIIEINRMISLDLVSRIYKYISKINQNKNLLIEIIDDLIKLAN